MAGKARHDPAMRNLLPKSVAQLTGVLVTAIVAFGADIDVYYAMPLGVFPSGPRLSIPTPCFRHTRLNFCKPTRWIASTGILHAFDAEKDRRNGRRSASRRGPCRRATRPRG